MLAIERYKKGEYGHEASLIPGKVYRVLSDPRAVKDGFVRIVDESGIFGTDIR